MKGRSGVCKKPTGRSGGIGMELNSKCAQLASGGTDDLRVSELETLAPMERG